MLAMVWVHHDRNPAFVKCNMVRFDSDRTRGHDGVVDYLQRGRYVPWSAHKIYSLNRHLARDVQALMT